MRRRGSLLASALAALITFGSVAAVAAEDRRLPDRFVGELRKAKRLHRHYYFDFDEKWWNYVTEELENEASPYPDPPRSFISYMDRSVRAKKTPGIVLMSLSPAPLVVAGLLLGLGYDEPIAVGFGVSALAVGAGFLVGGGLLIRNANANVDYFRSLTRQLKLTQGSMQLRWTGLSPLYNPVTQSKGIGLSFRF